MSMDKHNREGIIEISTQKGKLLKVPEEEFRKYRCTPPAVPFSLYRRPRFPEAQLPGKSEPLRI